MPQAIATLNPGKGQLSYRDVAFRSTLRYDRISASFAECVELFQKLCLQKIVSSSINGFALLATYGLKNKA